MPWAAAAVVGGAVVSSVIQGDAAQSAADTQANAATSAANTQSNAALQQQQNLLAAGQTASQQFTPYATTGTTALNNLSSNAAYLNTPNAVYNPVAAYQNFNNTDLNANLAPNYEFMLQQGQATTNAANNATGGLVGGNAQQALNTYSQNYASNAYQNALSNYMNQYTTGVNANMQQQNQTFNQQQANQSNIYNRLQGEAQLGLAGATGSANAQLGTATNVANLGVGAANAIAGGQIGAANAQAAGTIGTANAIASGTNTLGSIGYTTAQQLMNQNSAQAQLTAGGYGANSLNNIPSSAVQGSSNFIGPVA